MKCPRCGLVTFDHLRRCPRCEQSFDLVRPLTGRSGPLGPLVGEDAEVQERLRDRLHDARLSRRKRTANPLSGGDDDPDAPEWFEPDPVNTDDTGRRKDGEDEPGPSATTADPPDEEEASVNPPDSDRDDPRTGPVALEEDPEASDGPQNASPDAEPEGELPFDRDDQPIEGFQDWREELRARLKRIRARKAREREREDATPAPRPKSASEASSDPPLAGHRTGPRETATEPMAPDPEETAGATARSSIEETSAGAALESGDPAADETDERSLDELLDEAALDAGSGHEPEPVAVVGDAQEDPLADAELHPADLHITGFAKDPFGEPEAEEPPGDPSDPEGPGGAEARDGTQHLDGPEDSGKTPPAKTVPDQDGAIAEALESLDRPEKPRDDESAFEEDADSEPASDKDADSEPPSDKDADSGPFPQPTFDEEPEASAWDREGERAATATPEASFQGEEVPGQGEPEGEESVLEFGRAGDIATAGMDFDVADQPAPEPPMGPTWDAGEEAEEPATTPPPSISPSAGPLAERAAATACDGLVLVAVAACLVSAAASATGESLTTILTEAAVPLGLAWGVFAVGYGLFFNATCGQTIGRMVMKLRVVSSDEFSVGLRRAAVRMAVSLLSLLPLGVGALVALKDPRRRTLHDRVSRTRVVKA